MQPVSLTPVTPVETRGNGGKLPPVLLTPVVHVDLRISPRIFAKIRNDPNAIFRGFGKMLYEKKTEAKNLVTLSLYAAENSNICISTGFLSPD